MLRHHSSRAAIYCSILFLLLLLGGCGLSREEVSITSLRPAISLTEEQAGIHNTDMIGGQDYLNGNALKVLEENSLSISEVSSFSEGITPSGSYYIYHEISGLTNHQIQDSINSAVSQAASVWMQRPAIAEFPEEGLSAEAVNNACYGISTAFSWNCCDYLSGVITRTIDYYEPSDGSHTKFLSVSPLNYDLRTGDSFSLKALFTEDFDYMSVISRAVLQYGKNSGLSMVGFMGLEQEPVFCLSRSGLVVYTNEEYEDIGLPRNTPVTISFDSFGSAWAIGRGCDSSIYELQQDPSYTLLRQNGNTTLSEETVYYDEGTRFQVRAVHTCPEGFPESLFAGADTYINAALPTQKAAGDILRDETKVFDLRFTVEGIVIGNYYCVCLTGAKEESGEDPWEITRYFVYNSSLASVSYASLFSDSYDASSLLNRLVSEVRDEYIYGGYLFETEISLSDTDFIPDTGELCFATNPVKISHTLVAGDGTESSETFVTSLLFSVSYDEIGISNLNIFGQ